MPHLRRISARTSVGLRSATTPLDRDSRPLGIALKEFKRTLFPHHDLTRRACRALIKQLTRGLGSPSSDQIPHKLPLHQAALGIAMAAAACAPPRSTLPGTEPRIAARTVVMSSAFSSIESPVGTSVASTSITESASSMTCSSSTETNATRGWRRALRQSQAAMAGEKT